ELSVQGPADRYAAVGGRDAVQRALGVASLNEDLREGGLLEESNGFAYGAVLLCIVLEPVLSSPAIFVDGLLSRPRVPVRALPASRLTQTRSSRGDPIMQNAALHATRGSPLAEGPMVLIPDPECLHHPVREVARIVLPGMGATDVDRPHIHWSVAVHDPVRHH